MNEMSTEQTNASPAVAELTERLAWLEGKMAAAASPEQRRIYEEMAELTRNRRRCAEIEERTRVVLPPDNRWGASTSLPSASAPPAEPPSDRPSGWAKFDAIGPPPGLRWIDQQLDAADARDRMERIESERAYRQAVLDAHAEQKLIDEQRRRKQAERSCHVGPGDPDFDVR
jgi:hypothetical protein